MTKSTPRAIATRDRRIEELQAALNEQSFDLKTANAVKEKYRAERDAVQEKLADISGRVESLQDDLINTKMALHSMEVRAHRAEAVASALQDRLYPQRPALPWEEPVVTMERVGNVERHYGSVRY